MKTAVVILNWNGEKFLKRFLPALLASVSGRDAEVIVTDNASTDGSMKLMLYDFPKVRTIKAEQELRLHRRIQPGPVPDRGRLPCPDKFGYRGSEKPTLL